MTGTRNLTPEARAALLAEATRIRANAKQTSMKIPTAGKTAAAPTTVEQKRARAQTLRSERKARQGALPL
jgi:hypothetical protein